MTAGSVTAAYGAGNCTIMSRKRCAIFSWRAWKWVASLWSVVTIISTPILGDTQIEPEAAIGYHNGIFGGQTSAPVGVVPNAAGSGLSATDGSPPARAPQSEVGAGAECGRSGR